MNESLDEVIDYLLYKVINNSMKILIHLLIH